MSFRKAEKKQARLRLAITGTAGSGKTYGALLVAKGLGGNIAMIDTENGSGDLYADSFDYDVCRIQAPYTVQKYLDAISEAEEAGYDVLIIDSLSHAWAGEGGLLDLHTRIVEASKNGNSYTAWGKITPQQNKLIEKILTSSCHIIATMRAKTDYIVSSTDYGKTEIKKVGLAPVQRDGVDYEFSVVFDLSINHSATVSKDRTSIFDGQIFTLSSDTGVKLRQWLDTGVAEATFSPEEKKAKVADIWRRYLALGENDNSKASFMISQVVGSKKADDLSSFDITALLDDLKKREESR